jgi:hypothetical protein
MILFVLTFSSMKILNTLDLKKYKAELPALKDIAFRWELKYSSNTENKTIGQISYYAVNDTPSDNCIILVPGLASNTQTEPLMQTIQYWALSYKYDIYCIDTFLGRFLPEKSQELAEKHTFAEYINLLDAGFDKIESECKANQYNYSCLIGHSAGATSIFEIYNKRILAKKKLRFSASVMFAPYTCSNFTTYIKNFYKHRYSLPNISTEEFNKVAIGMISPHETRPEGKFTYISVLPQIFDDIENVEFKPELMDKYNIPITLVAAGHDKKSPPEELRKKYNILKTGKNGHLWKFVTFKDSKHSFIDQYGDWRAIIKLILSQKKHTKKK